MGAAASRAARSAACRHTRARRPATGAVNPSVRRLTFRTVLPYLLLAALCAFVFFWRLGATGLFDLDEGLYAESAREMAVTGDFVTPRVNGVPFFEKPPLIYWMASG